MTKLDVSQLERCRGKRLVGIRSGEVDYMNDSNQDELILVFGEKSRIEVSIWPNSGSDPYCNLEIDIEK